MAHKIDKTKIKKVLLITLSNIGDVIVSFPVIDVLRGEFPQAQLSVVLGPKGESLLKSNPCIQQVYVFDKHQPFFRTFALVWRLSQERFDLVVDLRNTAIPFLIGAKYRTSPFLRNDPAIHMRLRHLNRLKSVVDFNFSTYPKTGLYISPRDKEYVDQIIHEKIGYDQKFVMVCPSAADQRKRWTEEGFAQLCDKLTESYGVKIIFMGDGEGVKVVDRILTKMRHTPVNLSGQTTLLQLAELMRRSSLSIVNDSGPMHLASYLDIPVVTIFGPTDPVVAAPWGKTSYFIHKDVSCAACENPRLPIAHECMKAVSAEEIFAAIRFTEKGVTFTEAKATGLPVDLAAVLARGFMPRASGDPKGRPLTHP